MGYYLYRFRYKDNIIEYGIDQNIDRVYRNNFPNPTYYNKGSFYEKLSRLDCFYGQLTIEYIYFDEKEDAKHQLSEIEQDNVPDKWDVYTPKTLKLDIRSYMDKLCSKMEYLKDRIKKDAPLHTFIIENYNTEDECIWFEEKIKRCQNWKNMDNGEKNRYIQNLVNVEKKMELSPGYNIKVFAGYELDETSDLEYIIIKEKIISDKIPFLAASMYNSLIFASHEYNLAANALKQELYSLKLSDIPYYSAIKPLREEYTKEKYEEYRA